MNEDIEFKKRLEDLPLDFYFNNKEHFFWGCKKNYNKFRNHKCKCCSTNLKKILF